MWLIRLNRGRRMINKYRGDCLGVGVKRSVLFMLFPRMGQLVSRHLVIFCQLVPIQKLIILICLSL